MHLMDKHAKKKYSKLKEDPSDNPLIVHISDLDMLYGLCEKY